MQCVLLLATLVLTQSTNERPIMTTYLVNHLRIPNDIPNDEALEYLGRVESTFLPYGGKWLAIDQPVDVIEGSWPGSVVLMVFADKDTAKAWYYSPAYQEILHLRTHNTIDDLVLIDASSPDFTTARWADQIRELKAQTAAANT